MSSQEFIRALKAASDPPVPNGPLKIDIAVNGWKDTTLYVPRKEEVLADWILTKFHKDKTFALDHRYWGLLGSVLSAPQVPLKTWLPPILNRTSLSTAVISLLSSTGQMDDENKITVLRSASECLSLLWSLAVRKLSAETLLECLGALFAAVQKDPCDENIRRMESWISKSFKLSLNNSSNKKKVYASFTHSYISQWATCMKEDLNSETLYDSGTEILFNLDMLRQLKDNDRSLFDALQNIPLSIQPRLFLSFVVATKRHRGALFGQSSSQQSLGGLDDVRSAAVRYFVSAQGLVDSRKSEKEYWGAQLDILRVIKDQALFTGQEELETAFRTIVDYAVVALKNYGLSDDTRLSASQAADTLAIITSIEYALISPALPRTFLRLLTISSPEPAYQTLLDNILDYHSKTRTVNTLITTIVKEVPLPDAVHTSDNGQTALEAAMSSSLMRPLFLDRLGSSVHSFLTSSQIIPTLKFVSQTISDCCEEAATQLESLTPHLKARKKVSTSHIPADVLTAQTSLAVATSITGRFAGVVLVSLASESLTADARRDFAAGVLELHEKVSATLSKQTKFLNKWIATAPDEMRASATTLAALVRLFYILRRRYVTLRERAEPKLTERLLEFVGDMERSAASPELTFEAFRVLLDSMDRCSTEEGTNLMSRAIAYLQTLAADSSRRGEKELLLYALVERWLPLLDYIAGQEQLEAFVQILVEHDTLSSNPPLQYCVSSADFWELESVRECLLVYVNGQTALSDNLTQVLNIFELLLSFPVDYFPRHLNLELSKRALLVDASLMKLDSKSNVRGSMILRTFAHRVLSHLEAVDRSPEQAYKLLKSFMTTGTAHEDDITATIQLAGIYLSSLLQVEAHSYLKKLLSSFRKMDATSFLSGDIRSRCCELFIELLSKHHKSASFLDETRQGIQALYNHLMDIIKPSIQSVISSSPTQTTSLELTPNVLRAWRNILILGRWLGSDPDSVVYGPKLCLLLISSPKAESDFVDATFSVLKEELLCVDSGKRRQLLNVFIEAYVCLKEHGTESIDTFVTDVFRSLNSEEFEAITKILESQLRSAASGLRNSVTLATLLLQDPPKDTFQISQAFTSFCLTTFGRGGAFTSPSVRSQIFRFILHRCRERAAALRTLDVNAIWSIIAHLLAGQSIHDDHTSSTMFHDIVAVMTILVRLRRDLILQTLPHLGQALRQLTMLTRRPKPQLGGKQNALISDTFPSWLNAHEPLDEDEAKALSRLLGTLVSKTIVKTYSSSPESSKAESLAKPFSKHSAFVLTAYIDAASDPLCTLPTNVRKELQPGLFALCDMLNEHDRDAMMLTSLDATGKTIMKSLWKDYDKQRYIGRG